MSVNKFIPFSAAMPTGGEAIWFQIGGAGNAVSGNFWSLCAAEHGLSLAGELVTNSVEESQKRHAFFQEGSDGTYTPRCIAVDFDKASLEDLGNQHKFLSNERISHVAGEGKTNLDYMQTKTRVGPELSAPLKEAYRKAAERCDRVKSVNLCYSSPGGTGGPVAQCIDFGDDGLECSFDGAVLEGNKAGVNHYIIGADSKVDRLLRTRMRNSALTMYQRLDPNSNSTVVLFDNSHYERTLASSGEVFKVSQQGMNSLNSARALGQRRRNKGVGSKADPSSRAGSFGVNLHEKAHLLLGDKMAEYLQDSVFPTLVPALEELLYGVKDACLDYSDRLFGDRMKTEIPDDFDPKKFLYTYLKSHNPFTIAKERASWNALIAQSIASATAPLRLPCINYNDTSYMQKVSLNGQFRLMSCGLCPLFIEDNIVQWPQVFDSEFFPASKPSGRRTWGDTIVSSFSMYRGNDVNVGDVNEQLMTLGDKQEENGDVFRRYEFIPANMTGDACTYAAGDQQSSVFTVAVSTGLSNDLENLANVLDTSLREVDQHLLNQLDKTGGTSLLTAARGLRAEANKLRSYCWRPKIPGQSNAASYSEDEAEVDETQNGVEVGV